MHTLPHQVSAVCDSPLELFTAMVSGMVHDLNHTGHSNIAQHSIA